MTAGLYAATGDSIAHIDPAGAVAIELPGSGARCLVVSAEGVLAGTPRGVIRVGDGSVLLEGDVFSLAVGADGALYAGTEPSALFRSDDGGGTWRELAALLELPSRPTWSFPPRPWTSHVRWIAPSPHQAGLLLVGIELGGLMRSEDGGETWADHRPGAQRDVHSLAWHPVAEGRAYEAGGGGSAWSFDAGRTWQPADTGRDRHYTWAVAADPDDPDRWYVSASTGPFAAHGRRDAQARVYRWEGDGPWRELRVFDAMPYALAIADGRLVAGLADGRLFVSGDRGETWEQVALSGDELPGVLALVSATP
jgi:photosystem II stability/assembly factor-like uncharacterized protein